jgi:hypothetical protein
MHPACRVRGCHYFASNRTFSFAMQSPQVKSQIEEIDPLLRVGVRKIALRWA